MDLLVLERREGQSDDQKFFAIRKIFVSRLITRYRPSDGHAFGRAGRRPFCRDFLLKSEKFLLAKSRQAGKNFCGSKIFSVGEFWWNQKRAPPLSPLQGHFRRFARPEGVSKLLKCCPVTGQHLGRNGVAPAPLCRRAESLF